MDSARIMTVVRAASIVLVLAAIVAQSVELANNGVFDATRFFAFFTIQSNLIGVAAFAWLIWNRDRPRSRRLELLRGAAAIYLTITFFVVIVLLSGVDVGLQLGWVDVVLHKLFPVVVVVDWLIAPPTVRLSARETLTWLVYPLIWTGLTLVRGAADGWYPYPFLDPASGGYGQVAVTAGAIIAAYFVVAFGIVAAGNMRAARVQEQPAS